MGRSGLVAQVLVLVLLVAVAGAFLIAGEVGGSTNPQPYSKAPAAAAAGTNSLLAGFALMAWPTPAPTLAPPPMPTATVEVVEPPPPEEAVRSAPPAPPVAAPAQQQEPMPAAPTASPDAGFAAQIIELVNADRAAGGLSPLSAHAALDRSALGYADLLSQLGILSHNADGLGLLARVQAAGYFGGEGVGETLWRGVGVFSAEEVVAALMASPPHRAILLDAGYRDIGAGCAVRDADTRCVIEVGG